MPEQKSKTDPFKPAEPQIPGVYTQPAAPPEAAEQEEQSAPAPVAIPRNWIIGACGGVLLLILIIAWWNRTPAPNGAPAAASAGTTPDISSNLPSTAPAAEAPLPIAPGEVATTEELAQPWAVKKFQFRNGLTGLAAPAMVVRLPGNSYWAFSLQEPFGKCELEFVTDLEKLRNEYGYAARYPMVVSPCNHIVFDLMRYGNGPSGMVRGAVVQGIAIRPPMAIEVRVEGHRVLAERME